MSAPADFLGKLVEKVNAQPGRVGIQKGSFQFVLSGESGGSWVVSIADGRADLQEGRLGKPDVTIEMTVSDFLELAAGRLSPVAAYMSGRLKVSGDVGLALRLQPLLS